MCSGPGDWPGDANHPFLMRSLNNVNILGTPNHKLYAFRMHHSPRVCSSIFPKGTASQIQYAPYTAQELSWRHTSAFSVFALDSMIIPGAQPTRLYMCPRLRDQLGGTIHPFPLMPWALRSSQGCSGQSALRAQGSARGHKSTFPYRHFRHCDQPRGKAIQSRLRDRPGRTGRPFPTYPLGIVTTPGSPLINLTMERGPRDATHPSPIEASGIMIIPWASKSN